MPNAGTRGDALRFYLTGAGSVGASQTDPDQSLGSYRSSEEIEPLGYVISSAIAGITIDYIAGENGSGDATLNAPTVNTLTWTPPGGSAGSEVTILNGETKILEGADRSKWVRVSRTDTADLTGTATVTLTDAFNNVIGFDNVSSDEATAGDDEVRAICAYNEGTVAVGNVDVYLAELGTQATTDDSQLGSTGSGTIGTTSDSFSDWPETGFARIENASGTLQEIVYYSSRTDSALTIPGSDARGLLGTSATAGAADDEVHAVPGLRIAMEYGNVGTASFTGSGTDDLTFGGSYKGQTDRTYRVEIDGTGTPDTFRWSPDGGTTWEETGVEITGSAQTLDQGITVTFGSTTGHTYGDYWDSACTADASAPADENTIPSGLSWSTGITTADGPTITEIDSDEQVFLWIRRAVVADQQPEPDVLQKILWSMDVA